MYSGPSETPERDGKAWEGLARKSGLRPERAEAASTRDDVRMHRVVPSPSLSSPRAASPPLPLSRSLSFAQLTNQGPGCTPPHAPGSGIRGIPRASPGSGRAGESAGQAARARAGRAAGRGPWALTACERGVWWEWARRARHPPEWRLCLAVHHRAGVRARRERCPPSRVHHRRRPPAPPGPGGGRSAAARPLPRSHPCPAGSRNRRHPLHQW